MLYIESLKVNPKLMPLANKNKLPSELESRLFSIVRNFSFGSHAECPKRTFPACFFKQRYC